MAPSSPMLARMAKPPRVRYMLGFEQMPPIFLCGSIGWRSKAGSAGGRRSNESSIAWNSSSWSPAAIGSENTGTEWRSARQRGVCVYPVKSAVSALSVNDDGTRLLYARACRSIEVWDRNASAPARILRGHTDQINVLTVR